MCPIVSRQSRRKIEKRERESREVKLDFMNVEEVFVNPNIIKPKVDFAPNPYPGKKSRGRRGRKSKTDLLIGSVDSVKEGVDGDLSEGEELYQRFACLEDLMDFQESEKNEFSLTKAKFKKLDKEKTLRSKKQVFLRKNEKKTVVENSSDRRTVLERKNEAIKRSIAFVSEEVRQAPAGKRKEVAKFYSSIGREKFVPKNAKHVDRSIITLEHLFARYRSSDFSYVENLKQLKSPSEFVKILEGFIEQVEERGKSRNRLLNRRSDEAFIRYLLLCIEKNPGPPKRTPRTAGSRRNPGLNIVRPNEKPKNPTESIVLKEKGRTTRLQKKTDFIAKSIAEDAQKKLGELDAAKESIGEVLVVEKPIVPKVSIIEGGPLDLLCNTKLFFYYNANDNTTFWGAYEALEDMPDSWLAHSVSELIFVGYENTLLTARSPEFAAAKTDENHSYQSACFVVKTQRRILYKESRHKDICTVKIPLFLITHCSQYCITTSGLYQASFNHVMEETRRFRQLAVDYRDVCGDERMQVYIITSLLMCRRCKHVSFCLKDLYEAFSNTLFKSLMRTVSKCEPVKAGKYNSGYEATYDRKEGALDCPIKFKGRLVPPVESNCVVAVLANVELDCVATDSSQNSIVAGVNKRIGRVVEVEQNFKEACFRNYRNFFPTSKIYFDKNSKAIVEFLSNAKPEVREIAVHIISLFGESINVPDELFGVARCTHEFLLFEGKFILKETLPGTPIFIKGENIGTPAELVGPAPRFVVSYNTSFRALMGLLIAQSLAELVLRTEAYNCKHLTIQEVSAKKNLFSSVNQQDFSAFENMLNKDFIHFENCCFHDLAGDNTKDIFGACLVTLDNVSNYRHRDFMIFDVPSMRKSGTPQTSVGNTLWNISICQAAYGVGLVGMFEGDDGIIACTRSEAEIATKKMKEAGIQITVDFYEDAKLAPFLSSQSIDGSLVCNPRKVFSKLFSAVRNASVRNSSTYSMELLRSKCFSYVYLYGEGSEFVRAICSKILKGVDLETIKTSGFTYSMKDRNPEHLAKTVYSIMDLETPETTNQKGFHIHEAGVTEATYNSWIIKVKEWDLKSALKLEGMKYDSTYYSPEDREFVGAKEMATSIIGNHRKAFFVQAFESVRQLGVGNLMLIVIGLMLVFAIPFALYLGVFTFCAFYFKQIYSAIKLYSRTRRDLDYVTSIISFDYKKLFGHLASKLKFVLIGILISVSVKFAYWVVLIILSILVLNLIVFLLAFVLPWSLRTGFRIFTYVNLAVFSVVAFAALLPVFLLFIYLVDVRSKICDLVDFVCGH